MNSEIDYDSCQERWKYYQNRYPDLIRGNQDDSEKSICSVQ